MHRLFPKKKKKTNLLENTICNVPRYSYYETGDSCYKEIDMDLLQIKSTPPDYSEPIVPVIFTKRGTPNRIWVKGESRGKHKHMHKWFYQNYNNEIKEPLELLTTFSMSKVISENKKILKNAVRDFFEYYGELLRRNSLDIKYEQGICFTDDFFGSSLECRFIDWSEASVVKTTIIMPVYIYVYSRHKRRPLYYFHSSSIGPKYYLEIQQTIGKGNRHIIFQLVANKVLRLFNKGPYELEDHNFLVHVAYPNLKRHIEILHQDKASNSIVALLEYGFCADLTPYSIYEKLGSNLSHYRDYHNYRRLLSLGKCILNGVYQITKLGYQHCDIRLSKICLDKNNKSMCKLIDLESLLPIGPVSDRIQTLAYKNLGFLPYHIRTKQLQEYLEVIDCRLDLFLVMVVFLQLSGIITGLDGSRYGIIRFSHYLRKISIDIEDWNTQKLQTFQNLIDDYEKTPQYNQASKDRDDWILFMRTINQFVVDESKTTKEDFVSWYRENLQQFTIT